MGDFYWSIKWPFNGSINDVWISIMLCGDRCKKVTGIVCWWKGSPTPALPLLVECSSCDEHLALRVGKGKVHGKGKGEEGKTFFDFFIHFMTFFDVFYQSLNQWESLILALQRRKGVSLCRSLVGYRMPKMVFKIKAWFSQRVCQDVFPR